MAQYPDDADGDALRRVAGDGSDMSKPMEIDFSVVMPDEVAAELVGDAARKLGYKVEIVHEPHEKEDGPNAEGPSRDWTCYCTRAMVATYESVVAAQEELERIGSPLGGRCDGWGTLGNV